MIFCEDNLIKHAADRRAPWSCLLRPLGYPAIWQNQMYSLHSATSWYPDPKGSLCLIKELLSATMFACFYRVSQRFFLTAYIQGGEPPFFAEAGERKTSDEPYDTDCAGWLFLAFTSRRKRFLHFFITFSRHSLVAKSYKQPRYFSDVPVRLIYPVCPPQKTFHWESDWWSLQLRVPSTH